MRSVKLRSRLNVVVPALPATAWALAFVVAPMLLMLVYSFFTYSNYEITAALTLHNYETFFRRTSYGFILLRTLGLAAAITAITLILAFPFAYYLSIVNARIYPVVLFLVAAPLWTNTVVRNFAWFPLLGESGPLHLLVGLGLTSGPVSLLYSKTAVLIGGVYLSLPFAVLSILPVILQISPSLKEAARDLGAKPMTVMTKVVLPLSYAGLQTAAVLVFVPALGMFITPSLLGGTSSVMIANLTVPFFTTALDYAQGSALVFITMVCVFVVLFGMRRSVDIKKLYASGLGSSVARRTSSAPPLLLHLYAVFFLCFLMAPIATSLVMSFNEASLFPLRDWTLNWYREALANPAIRSAFANTFALGLATALLSIAIAAPLAYGLVRFRYRGSMVLQAVILIPMIVPSFMLGAALLILLNKVGLAFCFTGIVIGHTTYVMPYVFLVLLAQQQGADRGLEEAARDLGATSFRAFVKVVLPLMMPAIISAAAFAFTLSLDEFIITFLTSGSTLTVPLYIFGLLRGGIDGSVNALGTLIFMSSLAIFAISKLAAGLAANRSALARRDVGQLGVNGI
jgi:ABC-type spermidine/putrescine transport system permease subunit I